ncbi:PBP1A family penicillin-binding protein [Apilactobacillus apisilvae]|uniref:PBP1A family penicillin-binding protein n=1 Tax=Apilactobacillus apisilvae TaxID=2923364 RepID=A0ABY4PHD6_9LACO|nr:PBP1A family penicillin-binding protein [Apilactobacillus apisilvae]UQS85248.1 PBP1A family penicillin-binding protein [Apilactobacillus apisilvae]
MKEKYTTKQKFKIIWQKYQITRLIIVCILSLIFVVSAYCTYIAKTTNVRDLQSSLEQSTIIYDASNDKAGNIYSQKGTYVGYKNISASLPKAILSTEDHNFYHEYGFSAKGFARAMLSVAKNKLMHLNYISGGGSTLTQQLVKNAYLTQQQTFSRKLKELFLSIQVENIYSKKDIITMYMNNAYFGNGVYGVQDASKRYFGMNAKDLPIQDAAVLAGMLTNPSEYNPVDHPNWALQRRNTVLQLMVENGNLNQSTANNLKKTPIRVVNDYQYKNGYKYPYYFDSVIDEAINKYGLSESDIMNRGYKIYTNLNQSQQSSMQNNFENDSMFPSNASDGTKVQAASIAVDPRNGGVNAVVGGRGQHVFRGYNRATQIKRQPGSTMKPLAVYTPALQNGYNYDSSLVNEQKSYGKNKYTPKNYGGVYTGKVPMYKALAESMNAPAVWLLNKIGVEAGYDSVKSFGLPVTKKDKNLALALGGMSKGVSPQQMAGAYTAFANNGNMTTPHYIRKIVDSSGKVIVNNDQNESKKVMSKEVAQQMTSMMLGVFNNGTGVDAKPYGYQIAGKTGSTEADNTGDSDATRDKWIVGYTPKVVVATWEGFDTTNSNHHLENLSGNGVGPLFRNEMQQILPTTGNNNFSVKDAQSQYDDDHPNTNNKSNSGIWNSIQDGASKFSNNVEKGFDSIKNGAGSLFDSAKKFIGQ